MIGCSRQRRIIIKTKFYWSWEYDCKFGASIFGIACTDCNSEEEAKQEIIDRLMSDDEFWEDIKWVNQPQDQVIDIERLSIHEINPDDPITHIGMSYE